MKTWCKYRMNGMDMRQWTKGERKTPTTDDK